MNKMIERVAKAIDTAQQQRIYGLYDYTSYPGESPPHVVRDERTGERLLVTVDKELAKITYEKLCKTYIAKAAIEAMKEPTGEMCNAAYVQILIEDSPSSIFMAMIDAALKE